MKLSAKLWASMLLLVLSNCYGQKAEKLDSLFQSLAKEKKFNGNVLIAEKGQIIYQKSFGLANEETNEKLRSNSVFELASVSKQFTAMGIMILKEKGKLSLDDKMAMYIPELSFYKDITIKNLLQHTSGLPDYMSLLDSLLFDDNWHRENKIATNNDIIRVFEKHRPKLLFEPNEKWEYSNTGYAILASIIEKASGKSYADFLNTAIFKPLKMKNTFVYTRRLHPRKIKNYAFGYVYSDSLKKNVLPDRIPEIRKMVYGLDGIVGDGTVNSTTGDLLKWDRALYSERLVSKKTLDAIFTSGKLNNGSETGYGFGWMLGNYKSYGKMITHTGSWPGYRSSIERLTDTDKTIIYLLNNDNDIMTMPRREVKDILYNIKPLKFTVVANDVLQKYAGEYVTGDGSKKKILYEDNTLFVPMGDEGFRLELRPVTQTRFFVVGFQPDVFYEFIVENDKVAKYVNSQPDFEIRREAIRSE